MEFDRIRSKLRWVSNPLTIRSRIGAVEKEVIKIRPENRKPTLTSIGLEGGVDHSGDKLALIDNETDRTGAAQHRNTHQEPVSLGVLILLRLVQQHLRELQKLFLLKYELQKYQSHKIQKRMIVPHM